MKFGGTSVADAERIVAAAEIVRGRADRRPVVVVSAIAGVTDLLVRAAAAAREGARDAQDEVLADLARRHRWAAGAIRTPSRRHDLDLATDALLEELRQRLRSMRVLGEGTPRATDAILAYGEILSSKIVHAVFCDRGLPARLVDAREVVVTDAAHGAAEPDVEATARRATARLADGAEAGAIPVIGGFVGATKDGHTTTLGRGGSDTSAALLGSVLGAEEIEIWTDVDGILSADPRRVPAARTRAAVSFAEAAELAFYGAKVLHPAAVAPAVRRGIPVRVLNTLRPEASGTLVVSEVGEGAPPLASIASRGGLAVVRALSRTLRADPAFLPRVLAELDGAGLVPDLVVSTEVAVSVAAAAGDPLRAAAERLAPLGPVAVDDGRGIVCVVGSGLAGAGPIRRRVLSALARHDPEMLALGRAATSVAAVVREEALDGCVRDLHREFFEEGAA